MSGEPRWYKGDIGAGIFLFLLCVGIGSCSLMQSYGHKLDAEAKAIQPVNK